MKKFVVIYHAPASLAKKQAKMSKEDQAKGMEGWMQWFKKCGTHLVDMGAPLMNGKSLHAKGKSKKSTKEVAGYSILQASDMDHAIELLQGHPHIVWNADCSIEVHEMMPLPGM